MMCPWAARIGARRSLRPAYDVLTDPLQSSECLDRLSRAAVAKIASIAVPPPCDRIQISREIWILGAKPHARATQSQGSAGSGQVFPPARTGALGDWTWT